jgi:hypothetical protein
VSERLCPDCGARNGPSEQFCVSCGAFLDWSGEPAAAAQNSGAPAAAPPPVSSVAPPSRPAPPPPPPRVEAPPPPPTPPPVRRTSPAPAERPHIELPAQGATSTGGFSQTSATPTPTRPFTAPSATAKPERPEHLIADQWVWANAPTPTAQDPTIAPTVTVAPSPWSPPPAEAPEPAPGAVATVATIAPVSPGLCPNCRNQNALSRRFCENCGHQLKGPTFPTLAAAMATGRQPWWRRILWFLDKSPERLARKVWRRSLPVSFRIRRYTGAALVLALIVGGLSLIGRNPGRWIVDRWNELRGTQSILAYDPENRNPDAIVQAATDPPDAEVQGAPASAAVDDDATTIWSLTWIDPPPGNPPAGGTPCPVPVATAGPAGALVLTFGRERRVTGVTFYSGIPGTTRDQQHLPRAVMIGTLTGCQVVQLKPDAAPQTVSLDVSGTTLWISILTTTPPGSANPTQLVSFTDVKVLARP